MRYRRRKRQKKLRAGVLVLLVFLSAIFLVSCMAGSNVLWVRGLLGFDVTDYSAEQLIAEPGENVVNGLCKRVRILAGTRLKLETFHTSSQAVKLYRDEILNGMLLENFPLYSGNAAAMERAEKAYPGVRFSILIPAEDFSNTVSYAFGATSVSQGSGERFTYYPGAEVYSLPTEPWMPCVTVTPVSAGETLHSYRLSFTLSDGDEVSGIYTAVFVKRDDGSCYFRSLSD